MPRPRTSLAPNRGRWRRPPKLGRDLGRHLRAIAGNLSLIESYLYQGHLAELGQRGSNKADVARAQAGVRPPRL